MDNDTLWTSLPVPALRIGPDDLIVAVNSAGEFFLNASVKSLIGKSVYDRLQIEANLVDTLVRVRRDNGPMFINNVDVGRGLEAPVECNIQLAPVAGSPGEVLILMEPRDIAVRLNKAMGVKSAARSAIGMAEMLAHEIKNPLAGITGAAQLLSMSLSPEDQELTDLIVAESRRIVKLLEQVEQFGNLRPPEKRPVNIHDVLDRARRSALLGFAAHMTIVEDYDPSLPPTAGDADQLVQVFLNLIRNAAEAAPQGGTIRIHSFYDLSLRLRRPDGSGAAVPLQVEIIDDGPGIREDLAADIFDPFVSGRENGTGLGLALVSKILADHGGWISVDSVPGRTVFRVSLPVAPKTPPERTA